MQSKKIIITMIIIIILIIVSVSVVKSQSIVINNNNQYMVVMGEEEKAIKSSSSLIKPKQNIEWETTLNGKKINWKVSYIKETKQYTLFMNSIKWYESTTIAGIRSKYASELLGRNIKIQ